MNNGAQDALNRMARAHSRGTGCHLTAAMIKGLGLTFMAEIWGQDDPRGIPLRREGEKDDRL